MQLTRDAKWLAAVSVGALGASWLSGIRFAAEDLRTAWHLMDSELLRTDLLRSLFYLHAQPPLLNLIVGIALKLFGTHAPVALAALWASCAVTTALATRALAAELGAPRPAAFAAGAAVALAPATLLYVHHVGPEVAVAAALTVSALFLARGEDWRAFVSLGVACGFRSLLAPPLVLVALLAAGRRAWAPAVTVFAVLACIAAKNGTVAGSFSTSSWLGMNLARVTTVRLPPALRAQLSPVAQVAPFAPAAEYLQHLALERTGVRALDDAHKESGATNYNHLVYARASRVLVQDDLRAIALAPGAAFTGWAVAWAQFFRPSDEWPFLAANRERMAAWADFWDRVILLQMPLPRLLLGQTEVYLTLLLGFMFVFVFAFRRARSPASWTALAAAFARRA
jgi:hypothetical protein